VPIRVVLNQTHVDPSPVPHGFARLGLARHPEIQDEIAIFRDSVGNPNSAITGWLTGMINVDRTFFEAAELLADKLGISFEEAWALLVNRLGFDPNTWEP
jgi:hypothetical protein